MNPIKWIREQRLRWQQRRMSPLGREILELLLTRGEEWEVSANGEDWRHVKSDMLLWNMRTYVRLVYVPGVVMSDAKRKAIFNKWDDEVLGKTMRTLHKKARVSEQDQVINALRLSQHKE